MKFMLVGISVLIILPTFFVRTVLAAEIRCIDLLPPDEPTLARIQVAADFNTSPIYQGNPFPQIVAEAVRWQDTVRYFVKPEKAVQDPRAQVLLLSGFGADYSIGMSMGMIARMLAESEIGSKSDTVKALRRNPYYIPIHAEAIDLPGVGGGPAVDKLDSLDGMVEWLTAYIQDMKLRRPGVPVYVLARSGSPFFVAEATRRNPDLIKGLIAMSALKPGDVEAWANSHAALVAESQNPRKPFVVNAAVIERLAQLLPQVSWSPEYFSAIKTLFLTGSADPQVSTAERDFYEGLSQKLPNIVFYDVPNALHNALDASNNAPATKEEGQRAYGVLLKFIYDVENGRPLKQESK